MEVHNNNTRSTVTIEDEIEVIDLDCYLKASEEVVVRWDERIQCRILEDLVGGNEQQLEKFLERYKKSLKEEATLFSDKLLVKNKFLSHIKSIYFCCSHLLFKKSHWTPYLEHFEDLLAEYCTLELSAVQHLKRKHSKSYDKCETFFEKRCISVYRHLCSLLSVCLQDSEKHIVHVLLKLRFNTKSPACREIMHGIFSYFMADLPQKDYSEEAFCRYFLALKRWQQVRSPKKHAVMEKIMYLRMNRADDCIKNDETIKTILGIRCLDSVGIFSLIADSTDVSKDAYFNYIRRNNGVREYESDSSLIINSDDECADSVVVVVSDDEASDDDIEIVQVSGPAPISIGDDEGGGIGRPPDKSIGRPVEENRSAPVLTTEKRHVEDVAREQTAVVIEEEEEEVLHWQLEDSEKCDNSEGVHAKEASVKEVSGAKEVVSMEEVVIENEEAILHHQDAEEVATNKETSAMEITSVQDIDTENEEEILEAFNDIAIEDDEKLNEEEMHVTEIAAENVAIEEIRKEKEVVNADQAQILQPAEYNEIAIEERRKEHTSIPVEEVVNVNKEEILQCEEMLAKKVASDERISLEKIVNVHEVQIFQPKESQFSELVSETVVIEESKTSIPLVEVVSANEEEMPATEENKTEIFEEEVLSNATESFEPEQLHFNATVIENEPQIGTEEETVVQEAEEFQKHVDVAVETDNFETAHLETAEETANVQELLTENADNVIVITLPAENAYEHLLKDVTEEQIAVQTYVIEVPYMPADSAPQSGVDENLQPPQEETEAKPSNSLFSISRLIGEDDKTKEKIDMSAIVPFDIDDPNLNNIICVDIEATQHEVAKERVCRIVSVVEKDGVPHILDDGVLTSIQDIPVTDANETQSVALAEEQPPQLQQQQQQQEENVVPEKLEPPVLSKQEQLPKNRTNGTKLKPAIKQPSSTNGLTGRITFTSKETLNIPLTQHLNFKEEDILNGENYFSGPVNGVSEYQDNSKAHNGILQRENKRKAEVGRTKQKRAKFSDEEAKCYEYASESVYTARAKPSPVRVHAVSFAANGVKLNDGKLREKNKKAKVVVPQMPLTEMRALIEKRRALIEKKKRACSERAATRLKEAQCRPLGMPKEKPSHVSLIQGRFDYKTPPQELQSRLVIPHTSHETSTPSLRSETTFQDKQKGNHTGGTRKTPIATRRRTKVNGESVTKPPMDVLFDSLKAGTDSSLRSKKDDKT